MGFGPGTYQLLVQVTPLTESSESYLRSAISGVNDTFDVGTITITPNDSADFGITAATVPTTVAAGSSVEIDPTITRTGASANDPYNIGVTISTDDVLGNSDDISLLQLTPQTTNGENVANPDLTFSVPETVAPGTYEIFVDVQNVPGLTFVPADTDPSDNVVDEGTITVTPLTKPRIWALFR